jgi:CheY-like chemotaxis protein
MSSRAKGQEFSLRNIADALPFSIFWRGRDFRYLGCNEFFARAAGLTSTDAVAGLSDDDMPLADIAERLREQDSKILETGEPWRVYDEQAVRSLARILLHGWGYAVLEAALPSEAIAIAERERDSIRLLLTGVVMPGMRGSELANHILPRCPSSAVLYMSGYPDDEGLGLDRHGSMVHFLAKPITPESLARKVRETIDGA